LKSSNTPVFCGFKILTASKNLIFRSPLSALAELSTRQIAETDEAKGLTENAKAGKKGGAIAKNARLALEEKTRKSLVTGENFLPPTKEKKKLNRGG
jgi:hypothetical protein